MIVSVLIGVSNLMAQDERLVHLTSAPVPGKALSISVLHPTSSAGRAYAMFWSTHSDKAESLPIPFVKGLFRLDLSGLAHGPLFVGVLGSTGLTTRPQQVPNMPALIGLTIDIQAAEFQTQPTTTIYLSDNDVVVTFTAGIGTVVSAEGTVPSTIAGDLDLAITANPNMGAPRRQGLPRGAFQVIRTFGQRGYVEGFPAGFSSTPGSSAIDLFRRDRVSRNLINSVVQTVSLPNGFDLAVLRFFVGQCTKLNPPLLQFALVSIERKTGKATLLDGSTVIDSTKTCQSTARFSKYLPQVAFSDDGQTAVAILRDSANDANGNKGPKDRVLLVRTDPSRKWTNGKHVLDVSPTVKPVHSYHAGSLRVAGELFFAEAPDPAGQGGPSVLYAGPVDGSAVMTEIAVPRTGTNQPFFKPYGESRTSADGKTMVFPIGGGTKLSTAFDDDVIAISGISKAGPLVVKNITKFATQTVLARFGNSTIGPAGIRASLAPDASRLAFVTGTGLLGSPQRLYVARTDGSEAGTLKSVMGTQFDPQVDFVGSVHFVSNDRVLFLAGSDPDGCDWYAYDITGAKLTNLTKTATGSRIPPFTKGGTTGNVHSHGTFGSRNGKWLYFVRGWGGKLPQVPPLTNNLVAIDVATLALKDITGNDFQSGGTAPDIFRGPLTTRPGMTELPWPALELQLRRSTGTSTDAFFVAENAKGVTRSVFHDCNVFRFDIENAGLAQQLTSYTGTGALSAVRLINHLTVAEDGKHVAFAARWRKDASTLTEDVFVVPAAGGKVVQLSLSAAGQSLTDGSIAFTGNGVAWSLGSGSQSVPFENAAVQWSRLQGQPAPLLLSWVPGPGRILLVLAGSSTNQ